MAHDEIGLWPITGSYGLSLGLMAYGLMAYGLMVKLDGLMTYV